MSRRLLVALIASIALFVVVAVWSIASGDDPPPADRPEAARWRIAVVGVGSADPAGVEEPEVGERQVADLLFDGLTATLPGEPGAVASLAESWTANPERTAWTFTLAEGRTFHDGSPVTADDVVASLSRVAATGTGSLAGARLDVVEGYPQVASGQVELLPGLSAPDERTVEVRLTRPHAELPEELAAPAFGIVPAGHTPDLEAEDVVGSGPYRLEAVDGPALRLALAEPEVVDAPDEVSLVRFDTDEAAFDALQEGRVELAVAPPEEVVSAAQQYGEDLFAPGDVIAGLGVRAGSPPFTDPAVRRALFSAIDRVDVVGRVWPLVAEPAAGLVPPEVRGDDDDPCGPPCAPDADRAREALTPAVEELGRPLQVATFDEPAERALAEAVVAELAEVDVPAEVVVRPVDGYGDLVASGDVEVFRYGSVGVGVSSDPHLARPFTSRSPDNVYGFADAEVDRLVEVARSTADPGSRAEAWAEVEDRLLTLAPSIPLAQLRTTWVAGDERVRGVAVRVDGTLVLGALRPAPGGG